MKDILLFAALAISLMGCSNSAIPLAQLEFVSFKSAGDNFELVFNSSANFKKIKDDHKFNLVVGAFMRCALEDDKDFTIGHFIPRTLNASFDLDEDLPKLVNSAFQYSLKANFLETLDNGGSTSYMRNEQVKSVLSSRTSIPCKVSMPIYASKPYYSEVMNVPTTAILEVLKSQ
jgi:hypothetical protein